MATVRSTVTVVRPEDFHALKVGWRDLTEPSRLFDYTPASKEDLPLGVMNAMTSAGDAQPRHRHLMDQIRYVLSGSMTYGKGKVARPGDCVYFPEGVFYGPNSYEPGEVLCLQWPGPSEVGRVFSLDEMDVAARRMVEAGGYFDKARGGRYTNPDGRRQEASDAIAEYIIGAPVTYAKPRMSDQVCIHTRNIPGREVGNARGVSVKHLAYFGDSGPNIKLLELAPDSELPAAVSRSQQVWTVLDGSLTYHSESYVRKSLMVVPNGTARESVRSDGGAEVLIAHLKSPGCDQVPFSEF